MYSSQNSFKLQIDQNFQSEPRWQDPMLPLFPPRTRQLDPGIKRKLFLVPTSYGEEFERGFAPAITAQSELPEIKYWVKDFSLRLVEILSTRRSPHQLARWCHRTTFTKLLSMTQSFEKGARIHRVHIRQPLESLAEVTATIDTGKRLLALVMRFEGLDKRWLCTVIDLIR